MSDQEPSPVNVTVSADGAQVSTIVAPGVVLTQFLPLQMVEDIYRGVREEQRKQKQVDIQVVRTMRNSVKQ